VNQFLHQFLNILPTAGSNYKNIYLSGSGTNAPPTGQGLLDKQTLIDQGNNVFTN
jgi:hypothetical protein